MGAVEVPVYYKVLRKGCFAWHGVILGGAALDPPPVGLGFEPKATCNYMSGLGLTLPRLEMDKAQERMDAEYSSVFSMASIGFSPLNFGGPVVPSSGPTCAGLVEWPEDSEEEDPTSGTAAVAYHKGSCSVVRLDADEVHLGVDDAAWVPAQVDPASAPAPSCSQPTASVWSAAWPSFGRPVRASSWS